jgi:low affinity Fe/Cu permease
VTDRRREFVQQVAKFAGSAWAWIILETVILIWLVSGLIFHFSRRWMLLVTTGTSIVTLFMVFLILKTRNRHTKTIALKLDQLQRTIKQNV